MPEHDQPAQDPGSQTGPDGPAAGQTRSQAYRPALGDYIDDCETITMTRQEFDGPFRRALFQALPAGAGFEFNYEGDQAVVRVSRPGDTATAIQQARATLRH